MAAVAACLICSGVSKSGSPAERLIISRPSAFRARAFDVMAMVWLGLIRFRRSAIRFMIDPGLCDDRRRDPKPPPQDTQMALHRISDEWLMLRLQRPPKPPRRECVIPAITRPMTALK